MARRRQIYEGKAKILYEGPEPGTIIQYFKDDATAFNAEKKGTINGKGVIPDLPVSCPPETDAVACLDAALGQGAKQ